MEPINIKKGRVEILTIHWKDNSPFMQITGLKNISYSWYTSKSRLHFFAQNLSYARQFGGEWKMDIDTLYQKGDVSGSKRCQLYTINTEGDITVQLKDGDGLLFETDLTDEEVNSIVRSYL